MTGFWQRTRRFLKGKMMRHMPDMITCVEFEGFILSYLEGTLPEVQRRRFEWHIRFCRECRKYLVAYRRTVELEKAVFADPGAQVPGDVPEDLVQAVLKARENPS